MGHWSQERWIMKDEQFYKLSFSQGGVVLSKRYVRGEVYEGVLVDGVQTAMKLFTQYVKRHGVE